MTNAIDSLPASVGAVGAVLSVVREHTLLPILDFERIAARRLPDEVNYSILLKDLTNFQFLSESDNLLRLTEKGERWLDDHAADIAVETEDTSRLPLDEDGDTKPRKPYAVSKLKMEAKQVSVFQALRKIERKEIYLNPDFQRAFVWDIVKQSRLIESILIRIPLPAFYLDATDRVKWTVVDGLQRLTTLYRYCRESSFPLTGLQFLTELEGYKFEELPAEYRVLIEDDTQLQFYNLMPGTPVEAKFTIFSRVNTGGMQLTPQEIRHALNQGKVTVMLARMAKGKEFLRATGGVVESIRMSDRELILRALAFMHLGIESYREHNELDRFLLNAMASFNNEPEETLAKLELEFIDCLEKVRQLFGRYAFRKFTERNGRRSPFNKALFEVWIWAVRPHSLERLMQRQDEVIDGFISLVNTSSLFARSISSSTGNYSAVSTRFSKIADLLKEVVK